MPRILLLSLGLVASMAVAVPARAGDPVEVVTVRAGTASGADAPSAQPGNATQPTSVVDRAALDQYVAPTGNYDDALRLTPSVLDVSPDGPGPGWVKPRC